MTLSREVIDQYRGRIRSLIYDLENSFGVPGASEEAVHLLRALIVLDRKWQTAPSDPTSMPGSTESCTPAAHLDRIRAAVEPVCGYIDGIDTDPMGNL